jgi:hypothetical protein
LLLHDDTVPVQIPDVLDDQLHARLEPHDMASVKPEQGVAVPEHVALKDDQTHPAAWQYDCP